MSVAVEEALVPISCAGVVGECPVYRALTHSKRAPDAARARELAPGQDQVALVWVGRLLAICRGAVVTIYAF